MVPKELYPKKDIGDIEDKVESRESVYAADASNI